MYSEITKLVEYNPRPQIERLRLTNERSCWVVDNALLDPQRIVDWALQRRGQFHKVEFNFYPGIFLLPPAEGTVQLTEFFNAHIRRHFDARRVQQTDCMLSLVTLPPQDLRPMQWLCHRDASLLGPQESRQASVLYLFKDSSLGGTNFYEPTRSAEETATIFRDASAMTKEAFTQKYAIEASYMSASNLYFTKVGGVEAKWNRMIFYDGYALHSGDIPDPQCLSDDPSKGRLTMNSFFISRRRAV